MTYYNNVDGMRNAINAKRSKYAEERRLNNKHSIIDLTEMPKPEAANKGLKASISPKINMQIQSQEDKGNGIGPDMEQDEYEKYDSQFDGQADRFLINSGATILHSEIIISDSSGRNRRIVRRT